MKDKTLINRFLIWRLKRINDRYFIIILSAIIGFLSGIAAYLLKSSVFYIEKLLTASFQLQQQNYWYVVYPAIGIFLTAFFIRYIIKDETRHGIPRILYVISKLGGKMKQHKIVSSLLGSSLTAGFGGSIGLEAPIISAGSSMGSILGQVLRLNYKTTILLIGCGAAGAMASIFTTPIAAVIFSLEVLMLDLTISSIIPLLMASATGAITTKLLFAEKMLVHFNVSEPFVVSDVPFFLLLGILTGLVSLYFNRATHFVTYQMESIKNTYVRFGIGATLLGILIFLFPPLYGEGYDVIRLIISGNSLNLLDNSFFYAFRDNAWFFVGFLAFLVVLKVIATTLTIESGGIGGIFAPSAISGGLTGFLFARLYNDLGFAKHLSEANFTLVGMAGVLGAVLHAPLTAIFLIAEMTNGYELIVPLMLTSTISFITIKSFDPHSIFTKKLAERGELLTHHKDQAVLTLLNVKDVIDKDIMTISPNATLKDLTRLIAKSKRNIFAVVEKNKEFIGLVILDDVREDMFNRDKYGVPITRYIRHIIGNEKVSVDDTMESVMEKFKQTGNYNLVVLNKGKYVGFVSRANIFNAYRQTLIDVSHE
ncbi:MAG: chloride channel protein [Bacteroidales bacterium]|nr:chloride channel protein [Bacteroidales bacterium]MCF8402395.1 chloride channel protein [Bacteroidales bacterium]